eukprot:9551347-Heterocapsa_arctica.AAC.1
MADTRFRFESPFLGGTPNINRHNTVYAKAPLPSSLSPCQRHGVFESPRLLGFRIAKEPRGSAVQI